MQRDVAFIVEVKPWGPEMGEDLSTIVDEFMDRKFLDQIRDHGKMISLEHKKARASSCNALDCYEELEYCTIRIYRHLYRAVHPRGRMYH